MKSLNDKRLWAIAMVLAQVITLISTFYWKDDGRHTVNGSVLVFFSSFFWIMGFIGLFDLLKLKYPNYSRLGLVYALYGALGGVAFAFEGLYSEIFQLSDTMGVEAAERYPLQMNLVLFWAGPAFPLSLLIYGIVLTVSKLYRPWVGILIKLAGVSFPLSRILRIEWLAHLNDLLLLLPVLYLAVKLWKNET